MKHINRWRKGSLLLLYLALALWIALSGTALLAQEPPAAPATAEVKGTLTLDSLGGDVWLWRSTISGKCTCEECDAITLTDNGQPVFVDRVNEFFHATVKFHPGAHKIIASCKHADGSICSSQERVYTERLRDVPTAQLRLTLEEGKLVADGRPSRPSDASGAPLVSYAWAARATNPAPLPLSKATNVTRLRLSPPKADGEYYLSLTVTDQAGKKDTAASYFVVQDGKARIPNYATENPTWIDNAVVYGANLRVLRHDSFQRLTKMLDKLKELGISAIWLSPCTTSRGNYGVIDYFQLRPDCGTDEDFHELIKQAHARGIRIMMDFVPNHTSIEHPYAKDALQNGVASRYYDFYKWDRATGTFNHYFDWKHLPNLNHANPEVERWMTEAFAYWVREFDVDGFRIDAIWGVKISNPEFGPRFRAEMQRIKPDIFLLAEASAHDAYYFKNGYDAAYDWTDDLGQWAMKYVFGKEKKDDLTNQLKLALTNDGKGYDPDALIFRFMDNNDNRPDLIARFGLPMERTALSLVLTLPGVPCIYIGHEVGLGPSDFPRDQELKIPFEDKKGVFNYYKQLVTLRNNVPALHSRQFEILDVKSDSQVFAYLRYTNNPADVPVLVVLNFSDASAQAQVSLPARFAALAKSDALRNLLGDKGDRVAVTPVAGSNINLNIPAYTTLLLTK